jgi:hypothetical protein
LLQDNTVIPLVVAIGLGRLEVFLCGTLLAR